MKMSASALENYNKLREIGKGSYGVVWLARHKKDKKQYVLKKMELHNASKRERKAAEQEAKLLSKLKHPNIVGYKDSFETEDGFLYIAMSYCEGGDLYTRLKEQKGNPLEERQIVEWFVQIAMALQYMHERNILHRDLKTQNIFLTKSKIIKVGDLGIARVLDNSTDMATTLIGTPYYMSPELFCNKPYNHKSDVWALGCCVYEMTTLKHAFNAKDMNSLVYKILRGKMPAMPKQYSTELVTLIKATLNQEPDRRPSVNRILRDPYIKKNIAIFLEGTKRRRSATGSRPGSGDRPPRSRPTSTSSEAEPADSARSSASRRGVRPRTPMDDESLEPLNVNKGLEPIEEVQSPQDDMSGSGGSRLSSNRQRPPTPKSRSPTPRLRANTPQYEGSPRSRSPPRLRANGPQQDGSRSPSSRHRANTPQHEDPSLVRPGNQGDYDNDQSSRPPVGLRRRRPEAPKVIVSQDDTDSPHVLNPKPVLKPRPLPPRPSSSDGDRSAKRVRGQEAEEKRPMKSQSPNRPARRAESGYVSSSAGSSTNSSKDDNGPQRERGRESGSRQARLPSEEPMETPRQIHVSARQRRREKKESETPRPPTARSVDIDIRRKSESDVPSYRRSADNAPKLVSHKRTHLAPSSQAQQPHPVHRKQPSITRDSSSSSESEEGDGPAKEKKQKEKEMNAFIHQLDTTLRLNKEAEKSASSEEEDEAPPQKRPEPSNGPKVQPLRAVPEARVVEVNDYEPPPRQEPMIIETIRGKTLSATGRLMDRIAILRKDCIRGLGYEKLKRAYDLLDNIDGDELEPQLVALLGPKDFELYAGKIWQLKFCEESAFGLN